MKKLLYVILFLFAVWASCKAFNYVEKLMYPGPGVRIE